MDDPVKYSGIYYSAPYTILGIAILLLSWLYEVISVTKIWVIL